MPFFSIIIPTYNRAEELKLSITSVLKQVYDDFELLIVDDGSTDNTADVVKGFSDTRISYIFQPNSERSSARNNGMRHAKGEYVCLLDCGDEFYPSHLSVFHKQILKDGNPVAIYKSMMKYEDGSRPDDLSYAYKGTSKEDAIRYVWSNGSQLICLCFHSSIGRKVAFPEKYFWFEDIHWLIRVVMAYPLKQIMAQTTRYLNADNSYLLKTNYNRYLDNCEACIRDLESTHGDALKAILGRRCFDVKIAELYLGFMVGGAIKTRQLALARIYLRKAITTAVTPRLLLKYIYYSMKLLRAVLPV
ncbi:MAG TPA: glycosyltransferase family 2 protein [Flavipsychrobacter sp.]|nr:glycosyltransferase family 2 protein [Flavipsychrobacter sp.]